MPAIAIEVFGLGELEFAMREFRNPLCIGALVGPALGAGADVVAKRARVRNFEFTDRSGRLRKSIRSRRIAARYLGRRVRGGRAAVYAGGAGARQAFQVHEGHGPPVGPRGSPPYAYLTEALLQSQGDTGGAISRKAQEVFPTVARRYIVAAAKRGGTSRDAVFGRTVARRGRRR